MLDLLELTQRFSNPVSSIACGSILCGFLSLARGLTVFLEFACERGKLCLGFLKMIAECLLAVERGRSGCRTDANAVLRHALHRHELLARECRHTADQEPLQKLRVLHAEVGQRVVVHRNVPAEPLVDLMFPRQSVQFARAADSVERRVEPQRQEDLRIDRRATRRTFYRANGLVERGQIRLFHVLPHRAHRMILRDQEIEARRAEHDLVPFGELKSRGRAALGGHIHGTSWIPRAAPGVHGDKRGRWTLADEMRVWCPDVSFDPAWSVPVSSAALSRTTSRATEDSNMKGDDISNRLLDLAIACLSIASQIDTEPAGKHIARQLIRCSTSNGANYEEARSAESIADFVHKIGVAAKEVRETTWWLRIIDRKRLAPGEEVSRWIDEARQLLAILIASARTARERANRERTPVPLAQRTSRSH